MKSVRNLRQRIFRVSGDVRKSSLDDTRKGPPDDVAGVKDGRHGDNFSFL
jgi:hypothetical protein